MATVVRPAGIPPLIGVWLGGAWREPLRPPLARDQPLGQVQGPAVQPLGELSDGYQSLDDHVLVVVG